MTAKFSLSQCKNTRQLLLESGQGHGSARSHVCVCVCVCVHTPHLSLHTVIDFVFRWMERAGSGVGSITLWWGVEWRGGREEGVRSAFVG